MKLPFDQDKLAEMEKLRAEMHIRLARVLGDYPHWLCATMLMELAAHALGDTCKTKELAMAAFSATLDHQGKFGAKPC